ncbi:hypothetical protein SERLA73DRAFT_189068 [Serpula lacrymans var. lacrymans S7.3]|uniref:Uncharacterized protein n=1 Tax=Serpula lacrymans var. lacrymans (strain S7.3) TaxID=936435 RepID=F8QCS5_SERL3|nr:hypothetical protein SERLA73DRAFT_189068 [Serpula lacrymans var. lacrymans S7.3]
MTTSDRKTGCTLIRRTWLLPDRRGNEKGNGLIQELIAAVKVSGLIRRIPPLGQYWVRVMCSITIAFSFLSNNHYIRTNANPDGFLAAHWDINSKQLFFDEAEGTYGISLIPEA